MDVANFGLDTGVPIRLDPLLPETIRFGGNAGGKYSNDRFIEPGSSIIDCFCRGDRLLETNLKQYLLNRSGLKSRSNDIICLSLCLAVAP